MKNRGHQILAASALLIASFYGYDSRAATDSELKCEYLHCALESLLTDMSDERIQSCHELAKNTENTVFKGHFDQIMYWVSHNTSKDVISACPNKKNVVEALVNSEEKYSKAEIAEIEKDHLKMRDQILEDLRRRQARQNKGVDSISKSDASPAQKLPGTNESTTQEVPQDLSTEIKPGQDGMNEYLQKSMNIAHPMPLLPEHEKALMCEMASCGYASEEGLIALGSEERSQCNYLGALLVTKSFKGDVILFSAWMKKSSNPEYILKNCPAEAEQVRPYEKKKAELLEKNST